MAESFELLDSQGYTSTIYFLPEDPPRVCKAFDKHEKYDAEKLYAIEKAAYERFATHHPPASIPKYYGTHESIPASIVLEFAENKDLHRYIWQQKRLFNAAPTDTELYRWARQAVDALEFAHSVGVYNSDIHCINFLLDRDLNLKIADWAGASIDGSRSMSSYRLGCRLFDADGTDVARVHGIGVATEVFALGSAIYYMVTGHDPWPDLHESEQIVSRIIAADFPPTAQLRVLGDIIQRCWRVEFASMTDLKVAVDAEEAVHAQRSCTLETSPGSSLATSS